MDGHEEETTVAVIGAGPAGLTAAYLLTKAGVAVTVLEADPQFVGGISRTVEYKGFRFDIGGHRFFSKSREVEDLWTELLGADLVERPRSSRILYRSRFYSYPLKAAEALRNLGLLESIRCVSSYLWARVFPIPSPRSFEDWVTNHFGQRLFRMFFKTYTEKVWGMDCREISADWAAQRIKGLSLMTAIRSAVFPSRRPARREAEIKTLIGWFRYPRLGPGMMWEAAARKMVAAGGHLRMGCRVVGLELLPAPAAPRWRVVYRDATDQEHAVRADHVICSAALRDVIPALRPTAGPSVLEAARMLRYRDFITVALIVRPGRPLEDNWIYIHDPGVKVGRIQNFRSWSPDMVPDAALACYGLEYFCFASDGMWLSSDKDLIALATRELVQLGLAATEDVLDGTVVRQPRAYPVYDAGYATRVELIRTSLSSYPGLHPVGRNGMHKYNNQDHAMMTAMLTVRNILAAAPLYDAWAVNEDAAYHESGGASGERLVPRRVDDAATR